MLWEVTRVSHKSRDITLPRKVLLVKAVVFPVVMYGCESWTIKKAECQRIDAWSWGTMGLERLLTRVKEENEKADLKPNIQNMKIMASSPITSWQIMGKQWKQ